MYEDYYKKYGTMPEIGHIAGGINDPNSVPFTIESSHYIAVHIPYVSSDDYNRDKTTASVLDAKQGMQELDITFIRKIPLEISPTFTEYVSIYSLWIINGRRITPVDHSKLKDNLLLVKNQLAKRIGEKISIRFPRNSLTSRCPIIRSGNKGIRCLVIVPQNIPG
jgi:hypothetical protein